MFSFAWRLSLCFLASIAVATGCFAADDTGWDFPHFSDDAAGLYKAASGFVPAAGSDIVVLDHEESFVFDEQGRSVHTIYSVYKILTQNGVDQWGAIDDTWQPWHEERPAIRARVIAADGSVHVLEGSTIKDASVGSTGGNVYSDSRVLQAALPAIALGALVELEIISRENAPVFEGGIVGYCVFARPGPLRHMRLLLDAPASIPLRYEAELVPDLKVQRTEANGRVQLTLESGPTDTLNEPDDYLPSDAPETPLVEFSTGDSWKRVAGLYGEIVDRQIKQSDVKAVIAPLLQGKSSREEKITALMQYLDKTVRYTGIEFGESAIVPHTPAETLKQGFGDCKDKAALLVAMLRAAGIPSYVALLEVGEREDLKPDLPGMGFDHAIVYVPGDPEIWIDATDERARLGELPAVDQGRLALVARAETDSLSHTPVASSKENFELEKREFYLSESGPARVVEISEPHGDFEPGYRYHNSNVEDKDTREQLTEYMQNQYLAERLDKVTTSDATDISKQFTLTLEADRAARGGTDLDSSIVAIRFDTLFDGLPSELQQRKPENDKSADKSSDKPERKPRTADYQLAAPFATEWEYTIVPPPGFRPKPLPQDAQVSLGPASLTEEFSAEPDGTIHAQIRFDTVKGRFTLSEADEMRDKIAALREGQPIEIAFEPVGRALMEEGKPREAFQAYRDLVAAHPNDPIFHLWIARDLLAAGLGEGAREEAQLAVKLAPDSAMAQKTLAQILECDLVGRQYHRGADFAGAAAAYRAAEKLDPDDKDVPSYLAFILLHNDNAGLNGPGADFDGAIAEYKKLMAHDPENQITLDNLAVTFFYAGDFAQAIATAQAMNPQQDDLIVAAVTALHGSQAGMAEAAKRSSTEEARKGMLGNAGDMLRDIRRYPEAAALMEAGASGDDAARQHAFAAVFRNAHRREDVPYSNDPIGIASQFIAAILDGTMNLDKWISMSSRSARTVMQESDPEALNHHLNVFRGLLANNSLRPYVFADIIPQVFAWQPEGNDAYGYRIAFQQRPGGPETPAIFVVKEDGQYKLLGFSQIKVPGAIGLEILDRVAADKLDGARVLLDWTREDEPLSGNGDPLDGTGFSRIWTKGRTADAEQTKVAAAELLVQTHATAQQGVKILEAALASTTDEADKVNIELGLVLGYFSLEEWDKELSVASTLAKQYPESSEAFGDEGDSLIALGRYHDADALAQDRMKTVPDDVAAHEMLISSAVARGDYVLAHDLGREFLKSGKAEFGDMNNVAWDALFTGKVEDEDIENAALAAQLSGDDPDILHTLGCVYAAAGKTKEARDVLVQALTRLDFDEPTDDYWYAFGRIAEQFGEYDVAARYYAHIEKPKRATEIPSSTFLLAQNRLAILKTK